MSTTNKNNDSFNSILTTFYVSLGVGAALLILFESLRGRRNRMCRCLYRQRHSLRYRKKNPRLRVVDVPKYPRGFLAWTLQCWRMTDQEFLAQVGLDGYMVIRFIRLCRRLCWCAALLGMCILTPIYVTGGVYAHSSVFFLTMTNLPAGSESLWATVAFSWVFMLYLLHELRKEHLKFTALRNDWLANGDLPSQRQAAYSVMIESIPEAFRSPAVLAEFFNTLFPGQVHSASICLALSDLDKMLAARLLAVQRLSKASIVFMRKGVDLEVKIGRGPCGLCQGRTELAREFYGARVAELSHKLEPRLKQIIEAAATVEAVKREELVQMRATQANMAFFFSRQLGVADSRAEEIIKRQRSPRKASLGAPQFDGTLDSPLPSPPDSPLRRLSPSDLERGGGGGDGGGARQEERRLSAAPPPPRRGLLREMTMRLPHALPHGLPRSVTTGNDNAAPSMQEAQELLSGQEARTAYVRRQLRRVHRDSQKFSTRHRANTTAFTPPDTRAARRRLARGLPDTAAAAAAATEAEAATSASDAADGSMGRGSSPSRTRCPSLRGSPARPRGATAHYGGSGGGGDPRPMAWIANCAFGRTIGPDELERMRGPPSPRNGGSSGGSSAAGGVGGGGGGSPRGRALTPPWLPRGLSQDLSNYSPRRRHTADGATSSKSDLASVAAAASAADAAAAAAASTSTSTSSAASLHRLRLTAPTSFSERLAPKGYSRLSPSPPRNGTAAARGSSGGSGGGGSARAGGASSSWSPPPALLIPPPPPRRTHGSIAEEQEALSGDEDGAAAAAANGDAARRLPPPPSLSPPPSASPLLRMSDARRAASDGDAGIIGSGGAAAFDDVLSLALPPPLLRSPGLVPFVRPSRLAVAEDQGTGSQGTEESSLAAGAAALPLRPPPPLLSPLSESPETPAPPDVEAAAHANVAGGSGTSAALPPPQVSPVRTPPSPSSPRAPHARARSPSLTSLDPPRHFLGRSMSVDLPPSAKGSMSSLGRRNSSGEVGDAAERRHLRWGSLIAAPVSAGAVRVLVPVVAAVTDAGRVAGREVAQRAKGLGAVSLRGAQGVAEAVKILTVGSMSATGFVTFKTLSARASAVQSVVVSLPGVLEVTAAPEPRDLIWPNVTRHHAQIKYRRMFVSAIVLVGLVCWSLIVIGIQALTSPATLDAIFPGIEAYAKAHPFMGDLLSTYLPVVLLLLLLQNLYFIFKALAKRVEGYKSESEVERAVMGRYFYFQLANVYVSVTSGSILDALRDILENPSSALSLLGQALPGVAVYFTKLIIVKVVAGLMMELCFGGRPLKFWRILCIEMFTDPMLRTREDRTRGVFEPSEPWYGRFFADFLLVIMVVFVYQCIAPFVALAGLVYFCVAAIVYKYQLVHCYYPIYESGGLYFYKLFRQVIIGAVAGSVTLIGYMSIQRGLKQGPFLIPIPFIIVYWGLRWTREGVAASNLLSLDKAALQDREDELAEGRHCLATWETFDQSAYQQPVLRDALLGGGREDDFNVDPEASDVDADGALEIDELGHLVWPPRKGDGDDEATASLLERGSGGAVAEHCINTTKVAC